MAYGRRGARVGGLAAAIVCVATVAHADVTISAAATQNMNCAAGVCTPTAADAVLNVGDLETLLASGNVNVTTTGSGVQAKDMRVLAAATVKGVRLIDNMPA